MSAPHLCRGNLLWRLDADFGIPFPWRQNDHLVQKLVDPCDQVFAVPRFVRHIAEELAGRNGGVTSTTALQRERAALVTYVVHHERGDSSADLIVRLGFAMRTQQDEEEPGVVCRSVDDEDAGGVRQTLRGLSPGRDRDLGEAAQRRGLS